MIRGEIKWVICQKKKALELLPGLFCFYIVPNYFAFSNCSVFVG